MQQATHPRLHLRDAQDAHTIFEAVRQGLLTPIARRLNEMERGTLVRSGAVFVWFETEDDTGLKRWTDGRVWGQSRMREPYLFYDERLPYDAAHAANEANRAPAFRFVDGVTRAGPSSSAISHQDRSTNHHPGLIKQAYSAFVASSQTGRPQKWHITAYFTYADLPSLPTLDQDPLLRTIVVPPGIYRGGKSRARSEDDELSASESPVPRSSPDDSSQQGQEPVQEDEQESTTTTTTVLPPLSSVQLPNPTPNTARAHGTRLPEDQRLIEMLNSRHIR